VFVTAHRAGGTGLTNERHIANDTTYVIYMPGNRYTELVEELRAAGIGAGDSVRCDFARDNQGRNDLPHDSREVAAISGSGSAIPSDCWGSVVGLPAGEEAREEVLSGEFRSESFESCVAASSS